MSSVKCPMCNETIEGDGPDKLSMKLKVHLIRIHEMMVIDEVTRFSAEPSGGGSPESMKKIDAATRWSGESEETPESMKKIDAATRWSGESEETPESMKKIDAATRWSGESEETPESMKKIDAATRWSGESEETPESRKLIEVVTRFSLRV